MEENPSSCVRITVPASCKGAVVFKDDNYPEIIQCLKAIKSKRPQRAEARSGKLRVV